MGEEDLAVELDPASALGWPSVAESDIDPPDTAETTQLQAGPAAASSGGAQADFNGDGYSDLAIGVPDEHVDGLLGAGGVHVLYGSASGLTATNDQLWHQDSPGVLGDAESFDNFGEALAAGDFNGDGYSDLAIDVLNYDVGSVSAAGAVTVLYGSPSGLTEVGNQLWHQDSPGIEDEAEELDRFGSTLTSGDFNGDGYFDLAISVTLEGLSGAPNAGLVHIIYGSATGLTEVDSQTWDQDTPGVDGVAEPGDLFGLALAAGDFDRDGRDDLAIGVALEDVGSLVSAGVVNVLYGSSSGLSSSGDQYWHQDSEGIKGVAELSDFFGSSLAVGDFDNDGFEDLAVGANSEAVGSLQHAGAVNVIYGSSSGLSEAGDQYWHQNVAGVDGVAEPGDELGSALVAGDFNEDGRDDLAIGVNLEDIGGVLDAGQVNVLYGSEAGLSEDDDQVWHQDIAGVDGVAEVDDRFGSSLTAGDFDGDGASDLVIGIPYEDVGSVVDAGAINVLYGTGSGLREDDDQVCHQNTPGVLGTAEQGENFGRAVR